MHSHTQVETGNDGLFDMSSMESGMEHIVSIIISIINNCAENMF